MAGPVEGDVRLETLSLVTARVRDAYLRRPFYVDGATDLVSVCRELSQRGLTSALVRDDERIGIFTTTDLRDAILQARPPGEIAVREAARFELVDVHPDAELFEAMWRMVRHGVHRLVVRDGDRVLGVLGQLDLISFVANQSHIVAQQIDDAASVDDLEAAARRVDAMTIAMHDSGTRVDRIARLVGELNRRLFARLWSMLAAAELAAASCLVVLGSEGRGEQLLKTDQDNALIARDDPPPATLEQAARRFHDALARLGYPPCPGGVMVTTPAWRQSLAGYRETMRHWIDGSDPEGPMHLAIFLDAAPVAGDARLLDELRAWLDEALVGSDAFLARFVAPIDQFDDGGGWWTRLIARRDDSPLDLKKAAIFPLVHGVRALALQYRVRALGTAQRVEALVADGRLDATLGRDVVDALHSLLQLRLDAQLRERALGHPPTNEVQPGRLGTLERDRLHDCLAIVRRFRAFLRQHYRLSSL
ncbi:MAG: DUF294 nucleotidyltransferase-like domain-containing protein [Burkholderiaceae bacterium]|jgi:CBS domain-containing protein|nr:DUF294 nucleotidyltransferase-like domain-containing protein [Burkholderiaceae bacterium]